MKHILLFGAGRSATHLIQYLLHQAELNDWDLSIVDNQVQLALDKIDGHLRGKAIELDIFDEKNRQKLIADHDVVISLLPAHLHAVVAEDCYRLNRHLCTASYVTPEMEDLAVKARAKGLIFMGELGLDPGLDHMSALEVIDDLKANGANMVSFKSYTGGLVAPESDDNPWHYKISWNPRNVVLAGKSTATYYYDGRLKYIPYHQLFGRFELVDIDSMGAYEMYANRDSLSYRQIYRLEGIETISRGTLRHKGFCAAWQALVDLGFTSDDVVLNNLTDMTLADVTQAHVPAGDGPLKTRVANYLNIPENGDVMKKLEFLGLFDEEQIHLPSGSPARILEEVIKHKWKLMPADRDMIIMKHEFGYLLNGVRKDKTSTLIMKGENAVDTAMSKLVGLPLAIFVKLLMKGEINSVRTTRPVTPDIYTPILQELQEYDVKFIHRTF